MISSKITLDKLTGLSDQDLADVFARNPRAYMAVKGAVAEKHLENVLRGYKHSGKIYDFRCAGGDFDKDFYVTLNNKEVISLECKNVQVLNTNSKKLLPSYIQFLIENNYLQQDWLVQTFKSFAQNGGVLIDGHKEINNLHDFLKIILQEKAKTTSDFFRHFPQELRESGVPRYEYSASLIREANAHNIKAEDFIRQFSSHPLTIDFQRTRNSTDKEGDTRRQRLYRVGEIDVVGACLFSRTMNWQFIFGHSRHFVKHRSYEERYTNKFAIEEGKWSSDLLMCLEIH